MHPDASFESMWAMVQQCGAAGTLVTNWTRDHGALGEDFLILRSSATGVDISPPNVTIPRSDFETVFELWPGYVAGVVGRHQIRNRTRHSKYIISILHWVQTRSSDA